MTETPKERLNAYHYFFSKEKGCQMLAGKTGQIKHPYGSLLCCVTLSILLKAFKLITSLTSSTLSTAMTYLYAMTNSVVPDQYPPLRGGD